MKVRTSVTPGTKAGRQGAAARKLDAKATNRADGTPRVGERLAYCCPLCDKPKGTADYKPSKATGEDRWFLDCRSGNCQEADYLVMLADVLGCPSVYELIEDPRRWLADHIGGDGLRSEEPAPLPSETDIERWQLRLMNDRRGRAYLMERGLSLVHYTTHGLGYAPPGDWIGPRWQVEHGGFVLPVYRDGVLIGVRKRFWPKVPKGSDGEPIKMSGPLGRPSLLYPDLPDEKAVILAEGELDTLVARQHDLAVVTTTCGRSLPEHLAGTFAGKRVAVVYDTGSTSAAARSVERLLIAGAREAWAVELGLPRDGDDLTDWFVTYGNSADALRARINRARRTR